MTNTKQRSSTRKTRGKPAAAGEVPVPLILALPGGGSARFRAPADLTPRQTRPVEVRMTLMAPVIRRVRGDGDGALDAAAVLDGLPDDLTEHQVEQISELNDLVTFAYLAELRGPDGQQQTISCADDLLDLPTPVYEALRTRAAELFTATGDGGFSMPEDLDTADEDLPTSA